MKAGDIEDISISRILHKRTIIVEVHKSLQWLPFLYSILFCHVFAKKIRWVRHLCKHVGSI
jgi:hypothetical protein